MVLTNPVSGDTLNFTNTLGITGSYSSGTLTLTGNASVASYQTALQSVTFSSSNTSTPSTTPRLVTVQADDSAASPTTSDTITDTVDVTIPAPTVTAGGTAALYTAGGNAVTVDGGIKVDSDDTSHMTGATLVISTNEQSGDTLNFNNSNTLGITGSYSSGTLTLSGTATSANYQTALQSVTFNSSSTVTAARSITVQVDDTNASPTTSSTAADTVDVYAPATVTALYVKGTAWMSGTFDNYLGSHSLGNSATPTLGYALQTGANQSKDLPWLNVNVIEATFSEAVNVSQSSLVLTRQQRVGLFDPVGDRLLVAGWQHLCLDLVDLADEKSLGDFVPVDRCPCGDRRQRRRRQWRRPVGQLEQRHQQLPLGEWPGRHHQRSQHSHQQRLQLPVQCLAW